VSGKELLNEPSISHAVVDLILKVPSLKLGQVTGYTDRILIFLSLPSWKLREYPEIGKDHLLPNP
jgi:hypothetical protein